MVLYVIKFYLKHVFHVRGQIELRIFIFSLVFLTNWPTTFYRLTRFIESKFFVELNSVISIFYLAINALLATFAIHTFLYKGAYYLWLIFQFSYRIRALYLLKSIQFGSSHRLCLALSDLHRDLASSRIKYRLFGVEHYDVFCDPFKFKISLNLKFEWI